MTDVALAVTRIRIARWARACRGRVTTGWPNASAFVHANEGARGDDSGPDLPLDLLEVDRAVAGLAPIYKQPFSCFYLSRSSLEVKASRLKISRRTLMRRVELAERQVHIALMSCTRPDFDA